MFYGEHKHTIDRKGRIIVPAKFRESLQGQQSKRLFLTRGLDGCLFLFPEAEWRLAEERFKQVPFTKTEGRRFNRLFFSGATEVEYDRLGRILIPPYLKGFAELKREIVVVGVSNRIEILAEEKWREFYEGSRMSFEELSERLLTEQG